IRKVITPCRITITLFTSVMSPSNIIGLLTRWTMDFASWLLSRMSNPAGYYVGAQNSWARASSSSTTAARSTIPTSLTIERAVRSMEDPIDLARHDKIILVQTLNLLGAQRDGRITPAEAHVWVMTFGFSQVTDVANKAERFLKVTEAESSFDTVAVIT